MLIETPLNYRLTEEVLELYNMTSKQECINPLNFEFNTLFHQSSVTDLHLDTNTPATSLSVCSPVSKLINPVLDPTLSYCTDEKRATSYSIGFIVVSKMKSFKIFNRKPHEEMETSDSIFDEIYDFYITSSPSNHSINTEQASSKVIEPPQIFKKKFTTLSTVSISSNFDSMSTNQSYPSRGENDENEISNSFDTVPKGDVQSTQKFELKRSFSNKLNLVVLLDTQDRSLNMKSFDHYKWWKATDKKPEANQEGAESPASNFRSITPFPDAREDLCNLDPNITENVLKPLLNKSDENSPGNFGERLKYGVVKSRKSYNVQNDYNDVEYALNENISLNRSSRTLRLKNKFHLLRKPQSISVYNNNLT